MRKVSAVLSTNGSGFWSTAVKDVKITGTVMPYIDDEAEFGELHVMFDPTTWDVYKDGLIYTDRGFMAQLQELLTRLGYDGSDVSYSEQGMQGTNFVSLDIGADFIKSYCIAQLEDLL